MNIALLVLRLVPGLLLMGHGLQKLVPPTRAPRLLSAHGPRGTAGFFEQVGMAPGLPFALLAGAGELGGGFLLAAGLVTPLGTALIAAVMTVAILVVHVRKGIWAAEGGFEFPLLMLTTAYAASALGPGNLSIDSWAGISNWIAIHWGAQDAVRAGAAVGIGAAGGLLAIAAGALIRFARRGRQTLSPAQ
ncbi:MAG: DoxX family protein [Gaiellaceae bacterium]